jgi:alpha-glucosidase
MATFGTDLLASDSALDFLDQIAEVPPAQRSDELRRVLALAADDPSSLFRDIVPEEVMAAAVLVAASLPDIDGSPVDNEAGAAAALPGPASAELVTLAGRALDVVTAPDGWWQTSWVSADDAAQATRSIDELRAILARR